MCENIMKKIEEEKVTEDAAQAKLNIRRVKLLNSLYKRHEQNIELELKIGISKPLYKEITRPQPANEANCFKFGYINPNNKQYKDNQTVARLKTPRIVITL